MNSKTVFFIVGPDFSGTTMLDLMLSSLPNTKSLGEIYANFWPTHTRHLSNKCACSNPDCSEWDFLQGSKKNDCIHELIFNHFNNLNFLVDSSKSLPWLISAIKKLSAHNINYKVVFIYKDIDNYIDSCFKRGVKNPVKKWTEYSLAFLSLGQEFYPISLSQILDSPDDTLSSLCTFLDINFLPSMKDYQNNIHHTFFGSATARLQLHSDGSTELKQTLSTSLRSDFVSDYSFSSEYVSNNTSSYFFQRFSDQVEDFIFQVSIP